MSDIEPGAEAGSDGNATDKPFVEQIAEEQAAAEAAEDAPKEPPVTEGDEPPAEEQPAEQREPLTNEEYQERHRNITTALREERQEKRQLRDELTGLRADIAAMREAQPQQFQQYTIDQQIAVYDDINWAAWYAQNPEEAAHHQAHLEGLVGRKEAARQQSEQAQQQRQQEQNGALVQRFQETLSSEIAEYTKAKPDYQGAVQFLHSELVKEAELEGYFGPAADEYANRRTMEVAVRVFSAGQSMPEFAYKAAVARGYKPPAPDIASIKAGAEAAKSISTLGTRSANEGGTFEETMSRLDGAAARSFWEKAKQQRYG